MLDADKTPNPRIMLSLSRKATRSPQQQPDPTLRTTAAGKWTVLCCLYPVQYRILCLADAATQLPRWTDTALQSETRQDGLALTSPETKNPGTRASPVVGEKESLALSRPVITPARRQKRTKQWL